MENKGERKKTVKNLKKTSCFGAYEQKQNAISNGFVQLQFQH